MAGCAASPAATAAPAAAAAAAAAVGAFLSLLQHNAMESRYHQPTPSAAQPNTAAAAAASHCSDAVAVSNSHQQQYHSDIQQILAAHKQPSLLASLSLQLHSRQLVPHRPVSPQLLQQLWPSQLRSICSTAAVRGGSRDSTAAWPDAVPPLHQPQKHVTGANPNKARLVEAAAEGPAAATAKAVDSAAVSASSQTAGQAAAAESVFVRHRAVLIVTLMFFTTGAAIYSLLQAAFLGSTPGALRSHDAVVQKVALKQLQRVLSFRQAFGETVVQKLAEADILDALVAVLQPGTDALVVIETCEIIKDLLDSPTALAAMKQAGLSQAVESALQEGWVPTGAVKTVSLLHKKLKL